MIEKLAQEAADRVYAKYGDPKADLKQLAYQMMKWSGGSFEENLKALEISRDNKSKKHL